MGETDYLKKFYDSIYFNREELFTEMKNHSQGITEAYFKAKLQSLLDDGEVARVGRNAYCVCKENDKTYSYDYSQEAYDISGLITDNYPYLDFRIFELIQLNEFINHQIAHNTIFVSVEKDLGEFVFDSLKTVYPGKVLIYPTVEMFHQYWVEGMIVILKLPTESPRGKGHVWATCIEKMMVDAFCEKVIVSAYPSEEICSIIENMFHQYAVDESKLFRYARRRGVEKKFRTFLHEKTNITLRLENRKNDNKK